jgi:hypothetical protein
MSSDAAIVSTRSRLRLRFSLLALLIVITLICLILGWWQFIHLERQRLIRRRNFLEQHVNEMTAELKRKWDDYIDIARGLDNVEDRGAAALQEVDMKRLDHVDAEAMQIEKELYNFAAKDQKSELAIGQQRLANLRKKQEELKRDISNRARQSADLAMHRAELEHLQHMINTFSEELERLKIEAEVRGIPSK